MLLASDFDNTLWFKTYIKEKDVKAIKKFQNNHLFGICTGRSLEGVLRPSEPYKINYDFYICLSGALIADAQQKIIYSKTVSKYILIQVYDFLNHPEMSVVVNNQSYYLGNKQRPAWINIDSIDEIKENDINAFSFHFEENEIDLVSQLPNRINERFSDEIIAFQNKNHIDCVYKECSKGNGLKIIQDYFHLNDFEICGIGDSYNDLPFLKVSKHPFTFHYAPDELKTIAEFTVDSIEDAIKIIETIE